MAKTSTATKKATTEGSTTRAAPKVIQTKPAGKAKAEKKVEKKKKVDVMASILEPKTINVARPSESCPSSPILSPDSTFKPIRTASVEQAELAFADAEIEVKVQTF